jgi:hypothetical protein
MRRSTSGCLALVAGPQVSEPFMSSKLSLLPFILAKLSQPMQCAQSTSCTQERARLSVARRDAAVAGHVIVFAAGPEAAGTPSLRKTSLTECSEGITIAFMTMEVHTTMLFNVRVQNQEEGHVSPMMTLILII